MAYRVVFSPEAETHLVEIYRYVEQEASALAAQRFTDSIVDYCDKD